MSAPTPASRATDPSIALDVTASVWLWRYECALHGLIALLNLWVLWPWGWAARVLAGLLALGLMVHLLYRARLRRRVSGRLSYAAGRWAWQQGAVTESLTPRGEFLVWPWLIILRFGVDGKRPSRTLVLLPDSANADDLRRLRVLLLSRAARS